MRLQITLSCYQSSLLLSPRRLSPVLLQAADARAQTWQPDLRGHTWAPPLTGGEVVVLLLNTPSLSAVFCKVGLDLFS